MIRALSSNRLRLALLFSAGVATSAFACGGISDPTRNDGADGTVATVSGSLTGTSVPANARVALVWRNATATGTNGVASVEVGSDVPVVDGKFTMSLAIPSAAYFASVDNNGFGSSSTFDTPVSGGGSTVAPADPTATPTPTPAGGSGGKFGSAANAGNAAKNASAQLTPKDTAVGGTISQPLTAAIAGFVVYADTNGNGKLDLAGEYAASTDTILGGNQELILAYLKDGGALDYEKLRDKSGILPAAGFNVAWSEGRWLPLNVVELKLGTVNLPSVVCEAAGNTSGSGSGGVATTVSNGGAPTPTTPTPSPDIPADGGSAPSPSYPSPTDPNLQCSPDGKSFSYSEGSSCPPAPPAPVGLCAPNYDSTEPCASAGYLTTLPTDGTVPANWPCPVAGSNPLPASDGGVPTSDGGAAPDAG
jgi:hypothetical protein